LKFALVLLSIVSIGSNVTVAALSQCEKDLLSVAHLNYSSPKDSFYMMSYCGINIFVQEDQKHLTGDEGNYIGCHSIKSAHHCLIVRNPEMIHGLCVPLSCTEEMLPVAMDNLGSILHIPITFNVSVSMIHCGDHHHSLSHGGTVMLLFCILLILTVITATSFDILNSKKVQRLLTKHHELTHPLVDDEDVSRGTVQSQGASMLQEARKKTGPTDFSDEDEDLSFLERCLVAFSVRRNWAILMHRPPSRKYKALDGIRSISLIGVIIAHSANFTLMVGYTNPTDIYPPFGVAGKLSFILFIMVWGFAVDSFFFLSGFLSTLVISRKLDKGMNVVMLSIMGILHRFLRLTPTYAFVIAAFTSMGNSFGSGPFWWQMELLVKKCKSNWWTNILYINNFVPTVYDQQCLPWTWYLGNDFQFFVFGVLFMCACNKIRRLAEIILSVVILISIIISIYLIAHYDIAALDLTDGGLMQNYVYDKPYTRIPAYIVGMISVLYFMRLEKKAKQHGQRRRKVRHIFRFKRWFVAPMLMIAAIGVLVVIASFLHWDAHPPAVNTFNKTQNIFWLTFTRPCWAMAIAVITLLCITGQGGIVNTCLSWWFWVPVAQLTYSAYLIHPLIIRVIFFNRAQLFTYNNWLLLMNGVAFVILAYSAAIVLFCTIEMPFGTLEGLLIGGGKKRRKQVSTLRPKAEG